MENSHVLHGPANDMGFVCPEISRECLTVSTDRATTLLVLRSAWKKCDTNQWS